jgi:hypothetical protein
VRIRPKCTNSLRIMHDPRMTPAIMHERPFLPRIPYASCMPMQAL